MAGLDPFTRVLIVLVTIFVIWSFVKAYSTTLFNKKDEPDLDELIRKKTLQLTNSIPTDNPHTKIDNDQEELNKLKVDSPEYTSLKNIIGLKRDLEWGEGDAFNKLKDNFKKLTRIDPSSENVHTAVIYALKNYKNVQFNKLELIIFKKILVQTFLDARLHLKYSPFSNLSIFYKIDSSMWGILGEYFLLKSKISLEEAILSKNSLLRTISTHELEKIYNSIIISPTSLSDIMKELTTHIALLSALTPIKTDDPYIILGVNKTDDHEEIKKRYKHLALGLHPDKFASIKLSPKLQKIISDNFLKIQQAFDKLNY